MTSPSAVADRLHHRFGRGVVQLDPVSGAPVQFSTPADPDRRYLLDHDVLWHSVEHQWGSGFVVAESGSGRWNAPETLHITEDRVESSFRPLPGLRLTVARDFDDGFRERYTWQNTSAQEIRITSLGIQTPFADIYEDAANAVARAVHAHVFTGGSWAWVLAEPMSGVGMRLGLIVRRGELNGYSIESRNQNTSSNARGHILLHVTDAARNPSAFGGQPVIAIAPGERYELEWELDWYPDEAAFLSAVRGPAEIPNPMSSTTSEIVVRSSEAVRSTASTVQVRPVDGGYAVSSRCAGVFPLRIGEAAHTEVGFHEPLAEVVRKRAAYILRHQRSVERPGLLGDALVPVDTTTRLTQTGNGWSDWSDGSERIGMAIMLQLGRRLGWLDADVDDVLARWAAFARSHLLDERHTPRRGSNDHTGPRLYDTPWLARFFLERYRWTGEPGDLADALAIMERAFELGVGTYLAIGLPEVCADLAAELDRVGRSGDAARLRTEVVASAGHFLARGADIPAHEVSYEQSMAAPLVALLAEAHRITGDEDVVAALRTDLPKLLAFSGPQPYARLFRVAIRHWDGFWFGTRRLWGDVFPHHWSALTAAAIAELPVELRTPELDDTMRSILHGGMSSFFPDGSATCAFVLPTAVDGVAAHSPDPLANDQDWHLVIWMQLHDRRGVRVE
ncbi:hypothetical protein [Agromyces mangrovi Wang et al. 2018]|uniref:hypothetical protein n=1 Tax=Agromyces mangrovi TaxID=1858653 RepID=UPI0025725E6B|nr:hypothetical protein [Agromyces mangrovi]BDZ64427.1 hypothetical protein GCM10025877_13650 [Agromyces mangrovi]